jgi:hypothetical protein
MDIREAQASLRRYLAEGSKIIHKVDPLGGSTQANESFHAVKGKYTNKRLNFTTSTEARFTLGVISQSRNPGWQDELRESLTFPDSRQNAARSVGTVNQNANEKTRKGEKNPKAERKTKLEMSRE